MAINLGDPRQGLNLRLGGSSTRGAMNANPQTDFQPDNFIPEFLQKQIEPYIQRKQNENMFAGYMAQMKAGVDTAVLDKKNPINEIFGPTGYEEGAAFFRSQKAVTDWVQATANDEQLPLMDPAGLSKYMAESAEKLKTGNPTADALIQKSIIEQMAPLTETIMRKRLLIQQKRADEGYIAQGASASGAFQTMAVQLSSMSSPTEKDNQGLLAAANQAIGSYGKAWGQTDESWKKATYTRIMGEMQDGSFYAVELAKAYGVWDQLDEAQQIKLEDNYKKYATTALSRAQIQLQPDIEKLRSDIELDPKITTTQIQARMFALNNQAERMTGVAGVQLFEPDKIASFTNRHTDVMVALVHKQEARAQAQEDEEARAERARQEKAIEAQQKATQASSSFASGRLGQDIAFGIVESGLANGLMVQAWQARNTGAMVKNFTNQRGGWVSSDVKGMISNQLGALRGEDYSESFKDFYSVWKQLDGENTGTALAYFGDEGQLRMKQLDALVANTKMPFEVAFKKTFGVDATLDQFQIQPQYRREADKLIKKAAEKASPGSLTTKALNESGKRAVAASISSYVAMSLQHGTQDMETVVNTAIPSRKQDGSLEIYGRFAWNQEVGTRSISSVLNNLPEAQVGNIMYEVIDRKAKAQGFKQGAEADDVYFARHDVGRDRAMFTVMLTNSDGGTTSFTLSSEELQGAVDGKIQGRKDGMKKLKTTLTGDASPALVKKRFNDAMATDERYHNSGRTYTINPPTSSSVSSGTLPYITSTPHVQR